MKQGPWGPMTGRVGNLVGRMWKGRNVMAIRPASVADPKSMRQQMVRARFGTLAELASKMYVAVVTGMKMRATQMSITQSNAFIRENWEAVSVSSPSDVVVNYSQIKLSEGSLYPVTFGRADYGSGEHLVVEVPFTGNSGRTGADDADEVYIYAYVAALNEGILSAASFRTAGTVVIEVPTGWNGMDVNLWGFAVGRGASTNGKVSDSYYIGHGEIL